MPDLQFALMGCGKIARKHADAIAHAADARLVAVCDPQLERAKVMGLECGVPAFASLEEMLERVPTIDVVNVLTPSGHHAAHAITIAGHGKHVVVEKPMALRVEDADEMIAACDRAGVKLFVVKQNRYNAAVQRLRGALDTGRLGKLVMGTARVRRCRPQDYYDRDPWRGTWELDGGVLANQASHHVDLLMWMLGPVESVSAMAATRLLDIETEDTIAVLLRFTSGALGIIEATTAARPVDLEASLTVLGERGSVVIGGTAVDELQTWKFDPALPQDAASAEPVRSRPSDVNGRAYRAFLEDVVRAVRGRGAALVDGLEGRKSIEVINAIYESVQTGREVRIGYRGRLAGRATT